MKACKHCNSEKHSSTFCMRAPRKPIDRISRRKPLQKPKVKKVTSKAAKKKAWDSFSIYIRSRDCLETTKTLTSGLCVTCNERRDYINLQAGHFLGGRRNAVLFSEQGVHAQCYSCNAKHIGNGRPIEYWLFMERTYGRAVIDALIEESKLTVKFTPIEYLEIADLYKTKTEKLKNILA